MLAWWKRRVALKRAREVVKNTRKLVRVHRDIIAPADVATVNAATDNLAGAIKTKDTGALDNLTGKLDEKLGKAFPRQSYASLRENVEVFLVAAIVAMGVRTFFIQPFKIPTGSMEPTLYGANDMGRGFGDHLLVLRFPLWAERHDQSAAAELAHSDALSALVLWRHARAARRRCSRVRKSSRSGD